MIFDKSVTKAPTAYLLFVGFFHFYIILENIVVW